MEKNLGMLLEIKNVIAGSGLNIDEVLNIGGVIHLIFQRNCYEIFNIRKCMELINLYPFTNDENTIGYSRTKLTEQFP